MTPLLLNEPCMMLIVVGEFLSACLQVVHLFMVVFLASSRHGRLSCAYEFAVQLHLGIALCITVGTGAICAPLLAEVLGFSRFFWLLWANAAFSFIGLAFALYLSRPALLVDALLMGLCTPGAIGALGAHWNIVALLDVSWFMFRGLSSIVTDAVWRSEELTGLSVAEALMGMPGGILVTGPSGGSAFMNASMRSSLETLGLPTDLGDLSGIWGELSRRGRGICAEAGALGVPAVSERGEENLLVDVAGGRTLLFQRDAAGAKSSGEMILCLDVTESVAANKALVQTNRELEAAAAELRSCLADVDRAAEASAYLRMRSRASTTSWGSACRFFTATSRWERRTPPRWPSSSASSRRSWRTFGKAPSAMPPPSSTPSSPLSRSSAFAWSLRASSRAGGRLPLPLCAWSGKRVPTRAGMPTPSRSLLSLNALRGRLLASPSQTTGPAVPRRCARERASRG